MSKYCMGCMEQYSDEYEICPYCGYIEGTGPEQALHMEPGSILGQRYIVGKSIGYGGFGVTYIGWDALLEHKVAIKEYLPSEFSTRMPGVTQVTVYNGDKSEQFHDGLRQFVEEAKKLAKFNSIEGIVKVYDSFEENNTAYIVMEYLQGETLAQRLERDKTIDPEEAVAMLLPVIESLQQVHEQNIVHRDLAPDNLFITENGSVKVIDFGAARFATTSHSRSLTVIIKPGFSPEEQYRSRKEQGGYTDVYAIGATLYKMITGVTPPDALERYAYAESKNKDTLEPISNYYKKIDENTENAILNAMNICIEDRTQSMDALKKDLTSEKPVARVYGKIKRIDTLRWPLWAKITVPIMASLVLVFGILFSTGVIGFKSNLQTEIKIPEGMTRVPSVVNQTTQFAENRLEEAVLLYTVVGKEYSALVPADYVLTQDLTGGIIVMQNTILNITVSGGAEKRAVPYVANLSLEEAQALLEEAGFVLSKIEEYSSAIEAGYVISQNEIAGEELAIGSVITLVVSKGADPSTQLEEQEFELPILCGKSYEEVLAIAEQYGFKLTVSDRRYSNDYAANEIMEQTPAAGGMLATGATVEVVVSMGRQTVKIADVQYQTEQDAKNILQAQGLNVTTESIESETVAAGLVITQSPTAGTTTEPGATVHLIISKGTAAFDMPKVTGMTEADAKATLINRGLSVSVTYEYSTQAAGTVLKQSISPNTKVTRGTAVTITVSSGEETVKVPNVVGQSLDVAQSSLKAEGFKVTVNKVYSDTVPENEIINQNPVSGSSQIKGSTVIITVSLGKDTITGIKIASKPNKTTYFVEETLNPAGLTLTASYRSGKTTTISGGYTCSPTVLNSVGSQTITVTYEGLTASFTVDVNDVVLTDISLKAKPDKVDYFVGDSLLTAGLTLTATYSDGHTEEITGGFSCSPMKLEKTGTQTIRVSYYREETQFTVNVQSVVLTEIKIKTLPVKTSYYVNDTLDTAGLALNAYYNNGKTETVVTGFSYSPTSLTKLGEQTITVNYEDKTTTFIVTVKPVEPSSISVKTMPDKTTYYEGDTLNTSGLTLTVNYNNGTSKTVSSGFSCSPTSLTSSGSQTITVSYEGCKTTFTVTVKPAEPISISVKTKPDKTTYYEGDTLNTSGLTLTVNYNNGTSKTVSSGFSCSPTSLTSSGSQTITVSYDGWNTTFTVTVKPVEPISISVKTMPNKTTYYVGDTLNTSGLSLTVNYNNGTTSTVSSGFSCSPTSFTTAGSVTVTVSYSGKSTSFNVTVKPNDLESISISSKPNKTTYYVGEELDTTGLKLLLTYSNGNTNTVSSGFICNTSTLSSAGTKTITVYYDSLTTNFSVTVKEDSIVSMSSYSGYFKVLDNGVTIKEYPSSVVVGQYLTGNYGIRTSTSFTWPSKSFTVTTNSSATTVYATSSDESVVRVSTSKSGNVTTITVKSWLDDTNVEKQATVDVYLNGVKSATYTATVYKPHSLTFSSNSSKLLHIVNPSDYFGDGTILATGTSTDPSNVVSSAVAYLTVTTYNGNSDTVAITITPQQFTANTVYALRSGPGTGYSNLNNPVPTGTTLDTYGSYWDGTYIWSKVYYNGMWGYVAQYRYP